MRIRIPSARFQKSGLFVLFAVLALAMAGGKPYRISEAVQTNESPPALTFAAAQIPGVEPYYDQLAVAQGLGGDTLINIRNLDPQLGAVTSITQAFSGAAGRFLEKIGGGAGRTTFLSSGDLNHDGVADVVLSFGPVLGEAEFPNIIVVRDSKTREVIGHSFVAFPAGRDSEVQYNGGEVRTAVGDFTGAGVHQLAVAQGRGGYGIIRLYQYSGKPAPNAWEVIGQFYGLPSNLVVQGENPEDRIPLTLAAGDLDNDGKDELVVGQGTGPKSQTIFHVLDINAKGGIEARHTYAGFVPRFRGNGGIETLVADLNGDGWNEIIVASQGNMRNFGDERDQAPLNLIGLIAPIVQEGTITGFRRFKGTSVFNAFREEVNPSGAISIAAGEFDGNPLNGQELVVGTGAYIMVKEGQVIYERPAPQSRYRFIKIEMDAETVLRISNAIGPGDGFPAFVDLANPKTGAVSVAVIPGYRIPPVLPNPPETIHLDGFVLAVDRYDSYRWEVSGSRISGASGIAWTSFDCVELPTIIGVIGDLQLITRTLRVVETVRNPAQEISLEQALFFDAKIRPNENLTLYLPSDMTFEKAVRADDLASRLKVDPSILGILVTKKGDIKVRFENITMNIGGDSTVGTAESGRAYYPTESPSPPVPASLKTAGFTVLLNNLEITTTTATADAELEFPPSFTSGVDCQPARVDLGVITITADCQFHGEYLDQPYGPWQVCDTGLVIQGTGFVADFSTTWSWPGWTGDPLLASWRGVILPSGETIPETSHVISNIGYLKAWYGFENALASASGLSASFVLKDSFSFGTLQPLGYTVTIEEGGFTMVNCGITSGLFTHGVIALPREAVLDPGKNQIRAAYTSLLVQNDMDLYSDSLVFTQDFVWGEFSRTSPEYMAYTAGQPKAAYFYLSGTFKPVYWPLDGAGNFVRPVLSPPETKLEEQNMQGVTVTQLETLTAFTPDTPGRDPLKFTGSGILSTWLNVASHGVHAEFIYYRFRQDMKLGPTHENYYVGKDYQGNKVPFTTTLDYIEEQTKENLLIFQYVDSAVFYNNLAGKVNLEGPAKVKIPFDGVQLTSTAHIPAAAIHLNNPVTLDYWGLDLVQQSGTSSAGVMSIKTGQIFLTAAGLREERHFARPFYLIWGEIQSSGQLGRMVFDYNSEGQKFDGFQYVMEAIGLSPWDPADDADKKKAFLQTGGTVHFDFFGANYFNIKDYNNISKPDYPFNGRRIELASDTEFGTQPTDPHIGRNWGNSFGAFEFDLVYDDNDQDGFFGTGSMALAPVEGSLAGSIVLSSTRICMSGFSESETARNDFTLGPVAHFGTMANAAACACVVNGQVERIHLNAELETAANVNVLLRSANYVNLEWDLTPSISELRINGDMYLSLLAGTDVEVSGSARFTVNRDEDFVEGELEGKFSSITLFSGLDVEGRLEWHLGAFTSVDSYQSLQGRVAVQILAPIGGMNEEGGFYLGINAPKSNAWVLQDAGSRYSLNMSPLPDRLTGFYGYCKSGASINLYIVSGGYEVYVGLGAFVDLGLHPGGTSGIPGLPFVIGNLGIHIWGDILGGLVSAGAWGNLQLIFPYPFGFEGTVGLEGCVLWVICGSVDITVGLNSVDGFYID